jgi:non-specific protein-tyrosine kinase
LLDRLTVEVISGTEILLIGYEAPHPAEAQRLTNGFARAYRQFRQDQVLEELKSASDDLQDQISRVEADLEEASAEAEQLAVGSSERASVDAEVNSLTAQLTTLKQQQAELLDPGDVQVGTVVQPANRPVAPVSPDHVRNGILALVVGLLLGVGVAFLRERLDDRLRGRADLEEHIGAPVLAVVPQVANWKRRGKPPLVTLTQPKAAPSEAYRTLRTSLLFAAGQRGAKTVLVTSPHAGEGKTATAGNLAVVLAQARKRVILISADLRKPRLHRFFGLSNDIGLTSLLIGEARPWEAFADAANENLKVVLSGPVPGDPAELLGSDAMGGLLEQLREVADFVILDSAPILVVADALTLAPFVDAVLFVADAEHTTRGAVIHARNQLEQVNADVIGAVLNNFDPAKAKSSPYYYSYYYTYRSEEPPVQTGRFRRRRADREIPYGARGARGAGFEPSPSAGTGISGSDSGDSQSLAAQKRQLEGLWSPGRNAAERAERPEGAPRPAPEPVTGRRARRSR